MKITIESTSEIIQIASEQGPTIRGRIWEGETDSGIKVSCLITRIAANADQDLSQFERELVETKQPSLETLQIL